MTSGFRSNMLTGLSFELFGSNGSDISEYMKLMRSGSLMIYRHTWGPRGRRLQGPQKREAFWDASCVLPISVWSCGAPYQEPSSWPVTSVAGLGRKAVLVLSREWGLTEMGLCGPSCTVILVSDGRRQRPGAWSVGFERGAKVILGETSTLISFTRTGEWGGGGGEGRGGGVQRVRRGEGAEGREGGLGGQGGLVHVL